MPVTDDCPRCPLYLRDSGLPQRHASCDLRHVTCTVRLAALAPSVGRIAGLALRVASLQQGMSPVLLPERYVCLNGQQTRLRRRHRVALSPGARQCSSGFLRCCSVTALRHHARPHLGLTAQSSGAWMLRFFRPVHVACVMPVMVLLLVACVAPVPQPPGMELPEAASGFNAKTGWAFKHRPARDAVHRQIQLRHRQPRRLRPRPAQLREQRLQG